VAWIHLAHDRVQLQALVKVIMKFRVEVFALQGCYVAGVGSCRRIGLTRCPERSVTNITIRCVTCQTSEDLIYAAEA